MDCCESDGFLDLKGWIGLVDGLLVYGIWEIQQLGSFAAGFVILG
jgi:hypothetical protein